MAGERRAGTLRVRPARAGRQVGLDRCPKPPRTEAPSRHPQGRSIFYYHTGKEKAVVAVAQATCHAYQDPSDASGKLYAFDIAPVRKLAKPVTLAAIKADPAFASFALVRMSRLSVMPVTDAEWKRIEEMSRL